MTTISARIAIISKLLMTIASTQTADVCEAHHLTHIALLRILNKDPNLDHFAQILDTLGREIDSREEARRAVADEALAA
jgi:hypothetical protein